MRQGTTPTLIFTLPIGVELIKTVEIDFAQDGKLVLKKHNADVVMEGKKVMLHMTQEDTLALNHKNPLYVHPQFLLVDGSVPDTRIITMAVQESLRNEVLV